MDNTEKVDTLSFWQRMSFRANVPDWALGIPSVGGEFDIRSVNWNRWSAGFNVRWRPKAYHSLVKPFTFDLFEVTLEGREYWHERKALHYGYLRPHRHWWQKILSCRNMLPSHPNWIFYRGGYVSYSQYSMMFGANGRQGTAYMAGFTWGFVKPFLAFNNGMSLDLEFGVSAGAMLNKYDTYTYDKYNECYPKTGSKGMHIAPAIRDIHAAVVLRIGDYPIQKKYRWRYDVDKDFRARKDQQYQDWLDRRDDKFRRDSIYKVVAKEFRILYDSCVEVRHVEDQKRINQESPNRVVDTPQRQYEDSLYAMKVQMQKEKAERKAIEKLQREQDKKEKELKKRLKKLERDSIKSKKSLTNINDDYSVKDLKLELKTAKMKKKLQAKLEKAAKKAAARAQKQKEKAAKQQAKLNAKKEARKQHYAKSLAKQKAKYAAKLEKAKKRKEKQAIKEAQQEQKRQERESRHAAKVEQKKAELKAKIAAVKEGKEDKR